MQGLAIFVKTQNVKQITEDKLNHIIVLQPDSEHYADYYIMPTWELDTEPTVTKEDFLKCIENELIRLNSNLEIK